jgi:golgi phosphoprotein 3
MALRPLCLHHELALLALDDSKGTFEGNMYVYGFAGAILSEFLLQGVISASDSKEQIVTVLDSQPLGDPIMDEALGLITSSDKPRTLQYWVSKIAGLKDLRGRIAEQLAELGIVTKQDAKFLWFFTRTVWPEFDGSYEDAIRKRMSESMFSVDNQPEPRTAAL